MPGAQDVHKPLIGEQLTSWSHRFLQLLDRRSAWLAAIACAAILVLALPRIDFHADEAIYLQGVPLNASNDSGLVFHVAYGLVSLGQPTPLSARWTSLLFGVLLVFCVTRTLQLLVPKYSLALATVVPLALVVSYQGVFSIVRVRPEISWLAMASLAVMCLAQLRVKRRRSYQFLLIASLVALPMNHVLSWFACLFLGAYLICFGWQFLRPMLTVTCLAAMPVGVIANQALRSTLVLGYTQWIPSVGAPSVGPKPGLSEFLWNVFWVSPNFLNDSSAVSNIWAWLIPIESSPLLSHCLIATSLWAMAALVPLLMKSWESRFVTGVPLLTLGLFFVSGYFNPTYAPLLVIYATALFVFVLCLDTQPRAVRIAAGLVVAVSLVNGSSFLATRVLNHGPATFFAVESEVRELVDGLDAEASIAVAERFQSVLSDHAGPTYTLFKDELPTDIDVLVLDSYDFDMYRFVEDYDAKRKHIEELLNQYAQSAHFDFPVYESERLKPQVETQDSLAAVQGSWFFRNSVKYEVFVLEGNSTERVAADTSSDTPQENRR